MERQTGCPHRWRPFFTFLGLISAYAITLRLLVLDISAIIWKPTVGVGNVCPHQLVVLTTDFVKMNESLSVETCNLLRSFGFWRQGIDIPLHILGYGRIYIDLSSKLEVVEEAMTQIPGDCYVLFVDRDVLFNEDLARILPKFRRAGSKIVVSAECNPWPPEASFQDYPASQTHYAYGNSGSYIGLAKHLRGFIQDQIAMARSISPRQWQRVNDQLLLQEAIRGRHYNISIDHYNRLFQTMFPAFNTSSSCRPMNVGKEPDDHGIYDRPAPSNGLTLQEVTQIEDYYVNVYTRTRPSLLHFNGRIKELMAPFAALHSRASKSMLEQSFVRLGMEIQRPLSFADLCI